MKEKDYCRCCLSEECYKDMANNYYIGNKTENYYEMLLNVFNINISNKDAQRCLICEECVSKLRQSAAFKKQVLNTQEIMKKKLCWNNSSADIDTDLDPKIEHDDNDDFDDFYDDISDHFNESDFIWDNCTQDSSRKGQVLVIKLETKEVPKVSPNLRRSKTKSNKSVIEQDKNNKNTSTGSTIINGSAKTTHTNRNCAKRNHSASTKINSTPGTKIDNNATADTNDPKTDSSNPNTNSSGTQRNGNTIGLDRTFDTESDDGSDDNFSTLDSEIDDIENKSVGTKETEAKRIVKNKAVTAKQSRENVKRAKLKERDLSQTQLYSKYKRENTIKLILNSNLCLFRSFQNKFGCNFCKTRFPIFSQLREHSLSHSNPKTLAHRVNKFRLCGLSCKNAEISNLKCNLCSEDCTDLAELTNHLKNTHEILFHGTENLLVPYKLQNGFPCLMCDSKFNSYLRLSIHMNSHYKNNVCEMCGTSFINRLGLRAHVHSMHTEKKCSQCPAIFMTNAAKVKHLRQVHKIHNSKRYCNLCNKTFRYTYLLQEHKIQEHGLVRQICNCPICGKTFLTPNNLKVHVRSVHIKERNFHCTKCGRSFFTKCDQIRHERTHEDIRSFSCSYCDAKFKSKDSWRRHLKRQHGHEFGESSLLVNKS